MAQTQTASATAEALGRLARARDGEAWGVLLERHGPAVDRVCRRILGDETLAEDACQETWLQVRALAGRFRVRGGDVSAHEAGARGWVLAIAANVALHMQRKRRRDRNRDDAHAPARTEASSGEDAAMERERAEAVQRELAALNEADRTPIVMHYYGGLGYAELAAALDCPVGTAKARVSRGLEKLRQRLALLGLLLALGELDSFLGGSEAHAAEGAAAPEAALSQERLARWRELLDSTREPAMPGMAPNRGVSTMTKVTCVSAAVLLAAGIALWAKPGNGADAPNEAKVNAGDNDTGYSDRQRRMQEIENNARKRAGLGGAPNEPPPPADPAKPVTEAEKRAAGEAINAFAVDLYGKLAAKPGNLFVSPYSVSTALAMTYGGARGNTAAEMAKVLHLDALGERSHDVCGALIAELNAEKGPDGKPRGFQLAVANRLFGLKSYPFLAPFLALTKDRYGAPLEAVDFKGDVEGVRKHINAWVEERTRTRIKDLIPGGALMPDTRLVLVNAIYFKGDWAAKFDEKATSKQAFHLDGGKTVQAQLMAQTGDFSYREIDGRLQVLELPYAGGELSMVVLLPSEKWGMAGLEKDLTPANLAAWTSGQTEETVNVFLPKFTQTWGAADLTGALQAMGMREAFVENQARFDGITDAKPNPHIGMVLHKAFVEVNEEGTEAAAVTAIVLRDPKAVPEDRPVVFRADRPFLYAIRHNASGAILFLGRVMDPTKE